MSVIYLGIGGNLGDRRATLRAALARLAPLVQLRAASSLYETEPVGYRDQPDFLNAVLRAETELAPWRLLDYLKEIEHGLGRHESFQYAPRLIDLDILFYDDVTVDEETLVIPHPHLDERAFVLVPLVELAPELHHPWLGRPVRELLDALPTPERVQRIEGPAWADLAAPGASRLA